MTKWGGGPREGFLANSVETSFLGKEQKKKDVERYSQGRVSFSKGGKQLSGKKAGSVLRGGCSGKGRGEGKSGESLGEGGGFLVEITGRLKIWERWYACIVVGKYLPFCGELEQYRKREEGD